MSRLTLVVLLLVMAGLGFLAWSTLEAQKEDPESGALSRRLFPGVERDSITALRFDHIERNASIRVENFGKEGWRLVDPIDASADISVVKELLDLVMDLRGSEVDPGATAEAQQQLLESVQLSPPRVEFEVEWRSGESTSSRTIELGAVDLDARSLVVRDVESGRILRTLRTLDTVLVRGVSEFRNSLVLDLRPDRVVELHRTGTESFEAKRFGIALHAYMENDGWVSAAPLISELHPGPMGLLIGNVSRLRASGWVSPAVAKELSDSVLFAEPALRLDARYPNEEQHVVEIAHASSGRWYARNTADPLSIADITEETAFRLSVPFELLADRRLLRAPEAIIERMILERPAAEGDLLVLERTPDSWRVTGGDGTDRAADRIAVRDLIGQIERFHFHDLSADPTWRAEDVQGAFHFEGLGETWRIEVGGPAKLEERDENGEIRELDEPGVRVRRTGEELVFVAKQELLELLLEPTIDSFVNLDLIRVDELQVRSIQISGEGQDLRWTRSDRGRWTRAGEEAEAYEILSILDALFLLRAEAPLPDAAAVDYPVQVSILGENGELARYRIGEYSSADGPRAAFVQGEEAWLLPLLKTKLHEQLQRLIRAK